MKHTSLIALVLVGLGGCGSPQPRVSGAPPGYQAGYAEGCVSGKSAAGAYRTFTKDLPRFRSDKDYADGWTDGFAVCKGQFESLLR